MRCTVSVVYTQRRSYPLNRLRHGDFTSFWYTLSTKRKKWRLTRDILKRMIVVERHMLDLHLLSKIRDEVMTEGPSVSGQVIEHGSKGF